MGIRYNPKSIIEGLTFALDAANVKSYNTSGTTWTDISGNQNHGSLSSQLRTDVANKGSLYFDGTSSYAEGGVIEPTYFTLSCTFKATGEPSTNDQFGGVLICNSIQLTGGLLQYALEYSWANQRVAFITQTNTNVFATSDNSVLRNKIYKVDAVYDGSTQKIYVNGELVTSRSWTTNPVYGTTGNRNAQIGRFGYTGYERYFNGYIYEAKVYDRALTADEIRQNYIALSGRFQDPDIVTDGLVLNLDAANGSSYPASGTTWTDLSGNGNNGTLTNGPTFDPISGGSIVFDGTNDYVSLSNVQPGTNDFTISVWVYKNNNTSNDYVWDFGANGGTLSSGTSVSGYGFRYYNTTLGTSSNMYTQGTIPNVSEWYEVTITRNSGTSTMYVNGQSITSSSGDTHNISSTTLYIGRYGGGTGYEHDGRISNFKIYNRALSESEVAQNYNALAPRYSRPSIVSDGLSLCLDAGDSNSYPGTGTTWFDLSGNGRNATINGSPTYSNGYFSGISDSNYFSLSNSGLVPRTNDFTYSCWIYFNAVDSLDTIFENGSWTDTLLFRYQSTQFAIYAEGALRGTLSWTAITGSWVNLVLRRSSNTVSGFVNATSFGTPFTMTTDINLANPNLLLMRSQHTTNQFTNGRLASFYIYDRALSESEIKQNFNALRDRFGI